MEYFVWRYLKDRVYITPSKDLEDLRHRIEGEVVAFQSTRHVNSSVGNM
jgi:hypothetical protein